ncbi:ribosome maturation factor RimM [Synechococcus sp. M16CYN]|uniref:ribosome maturation factor RimM n=1 Tax=Synechococcus sp. M16CYN TaxID=3103139 RepID=UPI0032549001
MANIEKWLTVGKIVGVQGLRGEVRVNPASDFPERFTVPGPRWVRVKGQALREVQLKTGRRLPGKNLFVVRLKNINDRIAAEGLVDSDLMVPATDRPKLAEGEFHLMDLVGLDVRLTADGDAIGTVTDLIHGGNDLLEIKYADGRTFLIPFVKTIVPEVYLKEGWLLLTPPPGLLDL